MEAYTVSEICLMQEVSRQAYYQHERRDVKKKYEESIVIEMVQSIRKRQWRMGVRKLYFKLKPEFRRMHSRIGRDQLFLLLKREGLLVGRKRTVCRTTNSNHWYKVHMNLISDIQITHRNQVWVCDITYLRTEHGFVYLSLITDLYSRMIMGYCVSRSLSIEGSVIALRMAQREAGEVKGIIHHSDRGIQYCSYEYTGILRGAYMSISMGEKGNPYDNAVAERVNGILKTEFSLDATMKDYFEANKIAGESIKIYNMERPHLSLNYLTPFEVYEKGR